MNEVMSLVLRDGNMWRDRQEFDWLIDVLNVNGSMMMMDDDDDYDSDVEPFGVLWLVDVCDDAVAVAAVVDVLLLVVDDGTDDCAVWLATLNDWPHPHDPDWFGFTNLNSLPNSSSYQSILVPAIKKVALGSTYTVTPITP
jgi:hypothetical protein